MDRKELKKTIAELILREETYADQMEQTVEPYLSKRRRRCSIEREKGKKIYCECYQADQGEGIALICHGFTEAAPKYQDIVYYFLKMGYHVYLPEHCGHGRSYRLCEDPSLVHVDTWKRYVEDFLGIAHAAAKEHPGLPMVVFGHSMGGGIAAAAAAEEPMLFEKAVLTSPMIRPLTGRVPWKSASQIARTFTLTGRGRRYVAGQKPYDGKEVFETSGGLSRARFERWQKIKKSSRRFQLSAASYGWLNAAAGLNHYLQWTGWRKIQAPVLLFQAERETMVSKGEQKRFARKLAFRGKGKLICVHGAKHEIFSAPRQREVWYWTRVFGFLLP